MATELEDIKHRLTTREYYREQYDQMADDIEWAVKEVERLQLDLDIFLKCRHEHVQWCHECPDTDCCDNAQAAAQAAEEKL